MRIFDYEDRKTLNDVAILLDREEVDDLIMNLQRLASKPELKRVYLTDVEGTHIERELAIAIA